MKTASIIMAVLTCLGFAMPSSEIPIWQYTETHDAHFIVFPKEVTLELNIQEGDYIGVFYQDNAQKEACAGYTKWEGSPTVVFAFSDDLFTAEEKEGFVHGEEMKFKLWRKETGKESDLNVQFFPKGSYDGLVTHEQYFDYFGTCFVQTLWDK